METCKIKNLYNLEETIAKDLFEGAVYPWTSRFVSTTCVAPCTITP